MLLFTAVLCGAFTFSHGLQQDTHNPIELINMRNAELTHHYHDLKIQLTTNTTEISGKRAWVEVSWSGFVEPSFDDWIGVLAPADAEVKDSTPVKFSRAAKSPEHMSAGRGSVKFLLENHRTDLRIGFFYNGFKHPRLAGSTEVIKFLTPDIPSHGRITLTGDNTEMLVQWTTASDSPCVVQWGSESGKYTHSETSKLMTYTREEMCGGAAKHEGWLDPGVFHRALLTGLSPGARYFYRFGSEKLGFSDEFSFRAAPEVGPHTEFRGLMLADCGQAEPDNSMEQSEMAPSLDTVRWMLRDAAEEDYTLVGHFGDISYARGHVTQWDRFHEQMEPLVANVPYMVSIGNHERDWPNSGDWFPAHMQDSGGECGVAHERRFLMPSAEQDTPWFEYSFGPVHFIHYSTEQPFEPGSDQHAWVKAALERVNRTRTPWLIFAGHRPMYIDSTNTGSPDGDQFVASKLRGAFEELLLKHRVDLTFHGHHHSYQRTCPAHDNKCVGYDEDGVPRAPVHMVIGNAGAGLSINVHRKQPEIFEKVHLWWGYTRMHASGTSLKMEAVTNVDGTVFDTLELKKPEGWGHDWHAEVGAPHSTPTVRERRWWEADTIPTPPQVLHAKGLHPAP
eukprot:jgi/Ulvmu1/3244/UM150_0017.1